MLKWFIDGLRRLYPTIRVLEVLAVIAALGAFSYDFLVEKPRDRAIANASMYAQIASLDPDLPHYDIAMQSLFTTLLVDSVPIEGLDLPPISFIETSFEDIVIRNTVFEETAFLRVDIQGADFFNAVFLASAFEDVSISDARMFGKGHWFLSQVPFPERVEKLRRPESTVLFEPHLQEMSQFVIFNRVNFSDVDFLGVSFHGAQFKAVDYKHVTFGQSYFSGTKFIDATYAPVVETRKWDITFRDVYFAETLFAPRDLEQMNQIRFVDCIFENVKFPEGYELPEGAGVVLQ